MSEAHWYYAEDGEQRGPIEEPALRDKILSGELPRDTLVWSVGMENWAPAARVPSLVAAPKPPPPPVERRVEAIPATAEGGGVSGERERPEARATTTPEELVRPWKRLLARFFDLALFTTLINLAAVSTVVTEDALAELGWLPLMLLQALAFLAWAFIEPLFLARSGMTPGKWVFRVRVVHADHRLLTYGEALKRSLRVYGAGIGAGVMPFSVILPALAYRELVDHGATSWDRATRSELQYAEMKPLHTGIAAGFLLLTALQVVSVLFQGG